MRSIRGLAVLGFMTVALAFLLTGGWGGLPRGQAQSGRGGEPATKQGPTDPKAKCAILGRPQDRALLSGPGETALRILCGEIVVPPYRAPGRSPGLVGPTDVPETTGAGGTPLGETALSDPSLGADRLVNARTTDNWTHITQSETSVAVSGPTVLVGYNDSGQYAATGSFTGYSRSWNAGRTFTDMGTMPTTGVCAGGVFGDPVVMAYTPTFGTFYFANLCNDALGVSHIGVHKTTNHGTSWSAAVTASPPGVGGLLNSDFQDKEWMAVDTRPSGTGAGNIYVCWTRFPATGGTEIYFSRSTDGGASFTNVQRLSGLAGFQSGTGCQVVVSPVDGKVYVGWTQSSPINAIIVRRSDDFGVTWQSPVTVASVSPAEVTEMCGTSARTVLMDSETGASSRAIRSRPWLTMAVGPGGGVMAAWHGQIAGGSRADIIFSKSTNFGTTWTTPIRVNSTATGDQFFASMAVGASARIKIFYYNTSHSPTNRLIDVHEAYSDDGGATWTEAVVSGSLFDRPTTNPNFDTYIADCYMGDYNHITTFRTIHGTEFYMAWGDNRLDCDYDACPTGFQPDPDIRFDRDVGLYLCYRSATRVSSTQIDISWLDRTNYEAAYRVWRKKPGRDVFALLATLPPNTQTYSDTTVNASGPWEYQVEAWNQLQQYFGNSLCAP